MFVKVYSKEGCGPCKMVKNYLNSNGIPFEEGTAEDAALKGFRSVPVVETYDYYNGSTEETILDTYNGFSLTNMKKLKEDYFGTF